jgi:hypothetical protein
MIPVLGAAQAAPTAATQPAAAPAGASPSDADIQMLREDIRAKKKQIVAANMTLTPDEATKFWPLFDQYTGEVRKINDKRWAVIKNYTDNYKQFSDSQAVALMQKSGEVDAELIALRMKYMPQFNKLVAPKKVVQFYQIDRRLDLVMNLQIASVIPVIDPTK